MSRNAPRWTEYTSYTLMAWHMGLFEQVHAGPRPGAPMLYRGIWSAKDMEDMMQPWNDALTIVLQDDVRRLDLRQAVRVLRPDLGRKPPALPTIVHDRGSSAPATKLTIVLSAVRLEHSDRLLATLASLYASLPAQLVEKLIIICPDTEAAMLDLVLRGFPATANRRNEPAAGAPPIEVLTDLEALALTHEELDSVHERSHRNLQMALKLLIAERIQTDFYLVLDPDVLFLKPINASVLHWLFPEPGKAVFLPQPRAKHADWWAGTEEVMQLPNAVRKSKDAEGLGATPAILNSRIARAVVDRWAERYGGRNAALIQLLSSTAPTWAEHTAYTLMAWHMGLFEEVHAHTQPGAPKFSRSLGRNNKMEDVLRWWNGTLTMVLRDETRRLNLKGMLKVLRPALHYTSPGFTAPT